MGSFNREFVPWSFIRLAFVRMLCLAFLGLIGMDSLMQNSLACPWRVGVCSDRAWWSRERLPRLF